MIRYMRGKAPCIRRALSAVKKPGTLTVPGTFYSKTGMKAAALRAAAFSEASLNVREFFVI